jgi:membrane-associated protein
VLETLKQLIDLIRNMDEHLNALSAQAGGWTYAILFAVVFCETGLIVTPFLPGDSLLFAVGALSASEGSPLHPGGLFVLLFVAAVLGDAVNYVIGRSLGPKVFHSESSRLLNRKHLLKAQAFYEKHGGKAIFLARFVPIVRTFAPFVAGIGQMNVFRFWMFNVTGGLVWVGLFVFAGYFFGAQPVVKDNFELVILGIIVVSVLPIVWEWWKARRESRTEAVAGVANAVGVANAEGGEESAQSAGIRN